MPSADSALFVSSWEVPSGNVPRSWAKGILSVGLRALRLQAAVPAIKSDPPPGCNHNAIYNLQSTILSGLPPLQTQPLAERDGVSFPGRWHMPGIGQCFVTLTGMELSPSGWTWVGPESTFPHLTPLLGHPHPSTELDSRAVPGPWVTLSKLWAGSALCLVPCPGQGFT